VIGERPAHPLKHRGAQQELAHLGRLAFQHLSHEIPRHGPLAARELGHEALRIGMPRQRDRREAQAGRPPLGPLVEQRDPSIRERYPRNAKQLLHLLH
jgi:hypothetical protein